MRFIQLFPTLGASKIVRRAPTASRNVFATDETESMVMAEREGFEPPIPLRVCRISSAVH